MSAALDELVDFEGTPLAGEPPLEVTFNNISQLDPGVVTAWSWDFGDGGTSTEESPSHTYTAPGTYDVSLTATVQDIVLQTSFEGNLEGSDFPMTVGTLLESQRQVITDGEHTGSRALKFNGWEGKRLRFTAAAPLSDDFTVEAWVTYPSAEQDLGYGGPVNYGGGFFRAGTLNIHWIPKETGVDFVDHVSSELLCTVPPDQLTKVVFHCDGENWTASIDDEPQTPRALTAPYPGGDTSIRMDDAAGEEDIHPFVMIYVDDVKVTNTSPQSGTRELAAYLTVAGAPPPPPPPPPPAPAQDPVKPTLSLQRVVSVSLNNLSD